MLAQRYIDAIKDFEGFKPRAYWDVKHYSIGHGTRSEQGEGPISHVEAERRLRQTLAEVEKAVDRRFRNLPEGTHAALVSFTFNVGTAWMKSSGLATAVDSGDPDRIKARLRMYNKAGGRVLRGLVARRDREASWIG